MKGLMFALLCVLLLALGLIAAACGDDDGGAPAASEETSTPEDSGATEADAPTDLPMDDAEGPSGLPAQFGRGPEEAFVLAREACDMWEDWQPDGGEDALAPIVAKADEARGLSDLFDPVLEGLAGELGALLDALQAGEGSGAITLSNRLIGEICGQVG